MVSVDQEDKIRNVLSFMMLFSMPLFTTVIKDHELKLWILTPYLFIMSVLIIRKFIRDRRDGDKSMTRYYIALAFILMSLGLYFFGLNQV